MNHRSPSRRVLLRAVPGISLGLGVGLGPESARAAHDPFGPVAPPRPSPSLWLLRDDGQRIEMRQHLLGKISAVQLMFSACTATCPIQGALFASVVRRVRDSQVQFLSLSIDPTTDTPTALRSWLGRFGAPAAWRAAAPAVDDLDHLLNFFRGRAAGADRHSSCVYLFDRQARLVFRTADMPTARHVAQILGDVARR